MWEIQKLRSSLDTITEQSKAYVKKLVAKHREELDKNKVHLTELQEEVDNLKANAEAHTLEVNAKDYRLREVEERLTAALQGERDAKELLETTFLTFIELLPDYSDLVFSASFYLPKCIEERNRAKKYYKQVFRKIIKKGWPGKIDAVLDRQTDLVLLSAYGFYEYCATVGKRERKAILKDFNNMINLHLQDRLFF